MKILYGVQGTGNGHLSRTRALLPELQRPGIDIDFVFSGRRREDFFDMASFGDFRLFEGLTLFHERGRVQLLKTVTHNKFACWCDITTDLSQYDLVISDFDGYDLEAILARHCLSHQSAFGTQCPRPSYWAQSLQWFTTSKTSVGF